MLERLLQAAVITLLLGILASMSQQRAADVPGSIFRAATPPLLNIPLKFASSNAR